MDSYDAPLRDVDRFWDASGNFLLSTPQTLTLVQGDGTKASFTLFPDDTIGDTVNKLEAAIRNTKTNFEPGIIEAGKGLGQGEIAPKGAEFAYYVAEVTPGATYDTVKGTIVINSAITGKAGEIKLVGNEDIINAFSLTTIRESTENRFVVDVVEAHTDTKIVKDAIITGNLLRGMVHTHVDVEFDPMANVKVNWYGSGEAENKSFYFESDESPYQTYVHLVDNTLVYHIGANPLQDVAAAIGDMRAHSLGVNNILVVDRDSANRSIAKIDEAIYRVSAERSKLGALQNRLEHTTSNLSVASENLSAAESRIRDADMATNMMEFTKNQILSQAGSYMLAHANFNPQLVLQLLWPPQP